MSNQPEQNPARKSAITRIIIWSAVALLLLALIGAGLSGRLFPGRERLVQSLLPIMPFSSGNSSGEGQSYDYAYSERYSIGNGSALVQDIRHIDIQWIEGGVTVIAGEGDTITFSEESRYALEDRYKLHYFVENGTLHIQYCASRVPLSFGQPFGKALTVTIPAGHALSSFDLEAVSARVEVDSVQAESMEFEIVSGAAELSNLQADFLDLETVSGRTNLDGLTVGELSVEGVSGKLDITNSELSMVDCSLVSGTMRIEPGAGVRSIDASTVTGAISITLPQEHPGFIAQYAEGSGHFKSDFPVEYQGKRTAVYGDGRAEFDFSTISGSIEIEKSNP